MVSEICQTKNETVLKTAGKLCNSGEIGHMHILYCKVAQQTKFVISEAEGFFFFSQDYSLLGGEGLLQKPCLQEPQPPLDRGGQGWAVVTAQRLQPGTKSAAEGLKVAPGVW